jgi:hypothetical protein
MRTSLTVDEASKMLEHLARKVVAVSRRRTKEAKTNDQMIHARYTRAEGTAPRRWLGLSAPMIVLLAAIAAIRVPLHDLGIVQEGSAAAWLLVFVPLAVWAGVAGLPLMDNPVAEPARLTPALGEFLDRLHRSPWRRSKGW